MDEVFLKLLNLSVQAGWIVLAVLAIRLILSRTRAPKSLRCVLWGLVGLRLLFPFSLESVISLMPAKEIIDTRTVRYDPAPTLHTGVPFLDGAVNPGFSQAFAPAPAAVSVNPLQVYCTIAGFVWLAGMAVMLGYFLFSALSLRRRVAGAVETERGVREASVVPSPFVFGFMRPVIYLPTGMDGESRGYVLAHERAHIKRRDYLIKPLAFLVLAVYWFNPLIWLAYILLCRDIELACDEKVLSELGPGAKKPYSQALLEAVTFHRHVAACPVAFGEGRLKGRVKNVLRWKKPALWVTALSLLLCAALAACFLTDPEAPRYAGDYVYTGQAPDPLLEPFGISLREDGTFSYMEGPASSYIGMGTWVEKGGVLTLTDTAGGTERTFIFRWSEEGLRFVKEGSDRFTYTDVRDGELFKVTDKPAGRFDSQSPVTDGTTAAGETALNLEDGCEFVYRSGDPLDGSRTIILNPDGTFNYSGGILASTAWAGAWTQEGDVITLKNTAYALKGTGSGVGGEEAEVTNRFRVVPEGLAYIKSQSDGLIYASTLEDGAVFVRKDPYGAGKGAGAEITEIVDWAERKNIPCDTMMELFYEDGVYRYYFPDIRSAHVTVAYADGMTENVTAALEAGRIGIRDLDRFGIGYIAERK